MKTPDRHEVAEADSWDLTPLYPTVEAWRSDFDKLEKSLPEAAQFRGALGKSASTLLDAITCQLGHQRLMEKLYTFAHLKSDQDTTNSEFLALYERVSSVASRLAESWSYFTPELLSLSDGVIAGLLSAPELAPYHRMLREITRYKPHTLSPQEEQLLAAGSEVFHVADRVFSQLNNADLTFGTIPVDGTDVPLTHGSFAVLLKKPNRAIREQAFRQYYAAFDGHRHTIAATLAGSIKRDIYLARVRRHRSALEGSLFSDDVPVGVYENLIGTVDEWLKPLHRYYTVRKRLLGVDELRLYDTYVPLVDKVETHIPYDQAAEHVVAAVKPLGTEYQSTLRAGLTSQRWVDRYENKGKRSGAYSSGCYDSPPYMLMNYKADSLNDMFTLAHEAGHSMHTHYAAKTQPYQDATYTIFVAEVASTFNEQLLLHHLREVYRDDPRMLAYLINHQIDEIKSTVYRQTMFAEFERDTHAHAERHEPLTGDVFREMYGKLLTRYFGSDVAIGPLDNLECFRIPHFYHAFYVYKYATGISAAIALSRMVLSGGEAERNRYLRFLQSGGSKYPLELLQDAGVDLTTPEPIRAALKLFDGLVTELETTLSRV